jgi:hypothetical protein
MKSRTSLAVGATAIILSVVPLAVTASAAGTCLSGHFCAFSGISYSGTKLLDSTAPAGTNTVSVADNDVESGRNYTVNRWCAVEAEGWPDHTIFNFAPNSSASDMGSAKNKTEHFYVRSGSDGC